MKKTMVLLISGIMLSSFLLGLVDVKTVSAESNNILYVDDDGGENYTSIQSAIDNANDGDTVYVYNGNYPERIIINKSITLVGESRNASIDGAANKEAIYIGSTDTIKINTKDVSVSNFHIFNSNNEITSNGIFINADNVTVSDNHIVGLANGIYLENARNAKITNNNISNNLDEGIFAFSSDVKNLTISGNTIYAGGNVDISKGIYLVSTQNVTIYENLIISCYKGISIFSKVKNINVYRNNFIDTKKQSHSPQIIWYNEEMSEGNYWDEYDGSDSDGDGIGDSPYNISGGDNQDIYPLMEPYERDADGVNGDAGKDNNGDTSGNGTPGFELLLVFLAVIVISIFVMKRREL